MKQRKIISLNPDIGLKSPVYIYVLLERTVMAVSAEY